MTIEEIYPKVAYILSDVLDVDESEITLKSNLMNDLDAESIDFLDITFRLEREFGIKIPRGQIEKDARGALSEAEFEKKGVITDEGLKVLKDYLSEVPEAHFKAGLKSSEIPTLFTVETLCKLVQKAKQN
jgi:acyl carrier protein